jgi:hypothetical protein
VPCEEANALWESVPEIGLSMVEGAVERVPKLRWTRSSAEGKEIVENVPPIGCRRRLERNRIGSSYRETMISPKSRVPDDLLPLF